MVIYIFRSKTTTIFLMTIELLYFNGQFWWYFERNIFGDSRWCKTWTNTVLSSCSRHTGVLLDAVGVLGSCLTLVSCWGQVCTRESGRRELERETSEDFPSNPEGGKKNKTNKSKDVIIFKSNIRILRVYRMSSNMDKVYLRSIDMVTIGSDSATIGSNWPD